VSSRRVANTRFTYQDTSIVQSSMIPPQTDHRPVRINHANVTVHEKDRLF
jgi:hypothetical protein